MSEAKDWFILSSGDVSGPWTLQEAEAYLVSQPNCQIWKKGQNEWMNAQTWLTKNSKSDFTIPETPILYNFKEGSTELSKLPLSTLIRHLLPYDNLTEVYLCRDGESVWKEAYAFSEVIDSLGITRRQSTRVPLLGTLTLISTTPSKQFPAVVIGEGGLGITLARELTIGETHEAILESSSLSFEIRMTVEVVFVGDNGYAGLRFADLGEEHKGVIIEYVSKFKHS